MSKELKIITTKLYKGLEDEIELLYEKRIELQEHTVRTSRGGTSHGVLAGDTLVIRRFLHGGLIQLVSKDVFIHLGNPRPFRELSVIESLIAEGVSVPEPAFAVVEELASGFLYRGAIATKKIQAKNYLSLAYGKDATAELNNIALRAGEEARKMIQSGVYHPDLHLGNVLVKPDGRVVLIDFDKATSNHEQNEFPNLMEKTMSRWYRSAQKHQLSYLLAPFQTGLYG